MKILKIVLGVIAVLAVLMGVVWTLQGFNILPGSFMTGDINWAYRGGALAIVGLIVLAWATRTPGVTRGIATGFGGLMILMGAIWTLQGFNILPGSFMTGDINWAYRGIGLAVVGALLVVFARRK